MTSQGSGQVKEGPGVALVTGGAVRLGRAIALALARQRMHVAIGYHRSATAAESTVRALRAAGVEAAAQRADLREPTEARQLVDWAVDRFGRIDVLVNNAAVFERMPFGTTTVGKFDTLLNLNLRATFLCAQAAAGTMGTGWIVNIGDAGADHVWPGYIPYTLSKVAVHALTRCLAVALAPRIAVNCVAPGPVLRPPGFPLKQWRTLRRSLRSGPADVAAAVAFFATCPRSITGRVFVVGEKAGHEVCPAFGRAAPRTPEAGARVPRGRRRKDVRRALEGPLQATSDQLGRRR